MLKVYLSKVSFVFPVQNASNFSMTFAMSFLPSSLSNAKPSKISIASAPTHVSNVAVRSFVSYPESPDAIS
jgi:hypothetical protein